MNFKNLFIIVALVLILLSFSSYSKPIKEYFYNLKLNSNTECKSEEKKKNRKNKRKKKIIDIGYPVSIEDDYSIDNRITDVSTYNIYNQQLSKLNKILKMVALEGRKKINMEGINGEDYITTEPKDFNPNNMQSYTVSIPAPELKSVLSFLLNKINRYNLKDGSINKISLIHIDKNDISKTETKDQIKYRLNFLVAYNSNFYNNKINKDIKEIENLILNSEIVGKRNFIEDVFLPEYNNNSQLSLFINKLEIIGIKSDGDYLSGYDTINSNYKFINSKPDKTKVHIPEPTIPETFEKEYGLSNQLPPGNTIQSEKYLTTNNKHIKSNKDLTEKQRELLITDSIDSLLPDSYMEPELDDSLYSSSSENVSSDIKVVSNN